MADFSGFLKKEKKNPTITGKSAMKFEKIRNPKEPNFAFIPCGEKLYFSFIYWKHTTKEIYIQQQKRKNKEESLQIKDYMHKYTHRYIYTVI